MIDALLNEYLVNSESANCSLYYKNESVDLELVKEAILDRYSEDQYKSDLLDALCKSYESLADELYDKYARDER